MALLELLITETVVSSTACFGLKKMDELAKRQESLMKWELDGTPTPVLDPWLEKMAGTPETAGESKTGTRIVNGIRAVVNRKAFECVVRGIVNGNSELLVWFPFLRAFRESLEAHRNDLLPQKWQGLKGAL